MSDARPDVVVVGAGVAGLAAALAAREAGARVVLVRAHAGASLLAGGAWDVATDLAAPVADAFRPRRTLREALVLFAKAHPHHPYARLDGDLVALVRDAHALVLTALGIYRPLDLDGHGVLVATDLGLPRRAATAQLAVLDLAPHVRAIAVADLPCMRSPAGAFVAASLSERAEAADDERRFGAVEIEFCQRKHDPYGHPHELARIADREDGRSRLVQALTRALGGSSHDAVLLPAVLGLDDDEVPALVSKGAGLPAGELATPLAGPQGLRLSRRIDAALAKAGVDVRDARVRRVVPAASGTRVELEDGTTLASGATVLATGKHVGGGVTARRGDVTEPLAGLPLHDGGRAVPLATGDGGRDPALFYGGDLAAGGLGFRAGIGTDAIGRALGARGEPAAPDLFAAGAVLSGTDPGRDGTGLGAAATTGFATGKNAAKIASSGRP